MLRQYLKNDRVNLTELHYTNDLVFLFQMVKLVLLFSGIPH